MNKYYVYVHLRKTDNLPFYVGKGCGERAWNFNNRNNYWVNVKNKHGIIVEILFKNLSEQESLQIEKDTILEFQYFGYPLTNLSSGGESPIMSEETRIKMSNSKIGKTLKPEAIAKLVKFHTGRKRSKETCQKISMALKGKKVPKERAKKSALSRTGMKNVRSDKTIYTFFNETLLLEFIGTRIELCEKFNLSKKLIGKLFGKNARNSTQGWSLKGEDYDKNV